MGGFSNFAVSFTIISVLSGCLTLYYFGMTYGGPVDIVWGWVIVGVMTTIVGLGMAEIASAYPTAGGLYYWSAKLSKNNPGAWSWFTGWFNLLGQVAVTAGIDFGFATFFTVFLNLTTGYPTTAGYVLIMYAAILIVHGVLNSFGVRIVAFLSDVSAWWHMLGVLTIAVVLFFVPSHHASASFIFTKFENTSTLGVPWLRIHARAADGAVHLHRVRRLGPYVRGDPQRRPGGPARHRELHRGLAHRGVDPDPRHHLGDPDPPGDLRGEPPTPPPRWSSGRSALSRLGAELLLLIAVVAQAFCGMASVAANSRMLFAFSRDGAVPGHQILAPHQPADADADQLDLVLRRLRLHPGRPVAVERRGLRGCHVHRHHRPLHRLRAPDPAATAAGQELAGRPLVARTLEPVGRLARHHLGRLHRRPLPAPRSGIQHDQPGHTSTTPPLPWASSCCSPAGTGC